MRDSKTYNIMSGYDASTATFTAATTDIITDAAHGLSNGDPITVSSSTTLPAGLSANTVYYVIEATTDTFKLSTTHIPNGKGTAVNITDTGTGTHTWVDATLSRIINVEDFKTIKVQVNTTGTTALTYKFVGSYSENAPNPLATTSATNVFDFIEVIDQNTHTPSNGDTVITADAAESRMFEYNVNGLKWAALIVTSHTNGILNADMFLQDNQ
mgnify:CR=1 FL=1